MNATKLRSLLQSLGSRIDARAPRERILICTAAAALAFMVIDALLFGPALSGWQASMRQRNEARLSIERLQADGTRRLLEANLQQKQQQSDLAAWRQRVREGEAQLQRFEATLVGPDQMLPVLDRLLASQSQVRLRNMTPLGRTDLLADPADAAVASTPPPSSLSQAVAASRQSTGAAPVAGRNEATAAAPSTESQAPSLFRHGVQLTVEGSFADILAYVQALEAMPQRVLWGDVAFKVEQYPRASLTLQLYTISRDRHWLEI